MFSNDLVEWTDVYVRHRDRVHKKTKDIAQEGQKFICEYEDYKHIFLLSPTLEEAVFDLIKDKTTIVCLNKKANLKFVIENWDKFIAHRKLSVFFVNPSTNEKWSITPYSHNMISPNIKPGLKTLFSSIPEV